MSFLYAGIEFEEIFHYINNVFNLHSRTCFICQWVNMNNQSGCISSFPTESVIVSVGNEKVRVTMSRAVRIQSDEPDDVDELLKNNDYDEIANWGSNWSQRR